MTLKTLIVNVFSPYSYNFSYKDINYFRHYIKKSSLPWCHERVGASSVGGGTVEVVKVWQRVSENDRKAGE